MRFTSIFTGLVAAVSAVQAGVIGARIPSTGTATQMTRRTMHEFAPRAVQGTVCALVGPLGVGIPLLNVQVVDRICLCAELGVITRESLVSLTAQIDLGDGIVDQTLESVVALLIPTVETILGNSENSCTYPANSFPRCTAIDNAAGCNFGCDDGFKLCNAQCIPEADPCSTQARKRDTTAAKICPKSWVACPVFFGARTEWECVDVTGDLFSCGGCASLSGQGVDCTALPGVNDVMCNAGQCKASSCFAGYTLDETSTCVRKASK